MTTTSYAVEGLTCGCCMADVLENVHLLSGVTDVTVDLVTGGQSRLVVMSGTTLVADLSREAVESAGFDLTAAGGRELPRRWDIPFGRDGDTHPDGERTMRSIGGASS